jgi:hypothetical protein
MYLIFQNEQAIEELIVLAGWGFVGNTLFYNPPCNLESKMYFFQNDYQLKNG